MKNIHIVPTNKPTGIFKLNDSLLFSITSKVRSNNQGFYIYITSNEEITEGDWFYDGDGELCKYTSDYVVNPNGWNDNKKIILTTDADLIKDGVQAIDDEFLEWFVKNPSCEEVEVDLISVNEFGSEITVTGYGFDKFIYKIILPNEEPKQEPIKEAAERLYSVNNTGSMFMPSRDELNNSYKQEGFIDGYNKAKEERKQETLDEIEIISKQRIHKYRPMNPHLMSFFIGFNDGIEWQSKRIYSEEDMIDFGNFCINLPKENKQILRDNPEITTEELLQLWLIKKLKK